MLTGERLNDAVAIHESFYALLKWAAAAVDRGFVAARTAHTYMSKTEAAAGWIGDHYENLPTAAALLGGKEAGRDVALATFGSQLLRRCDGHSSTPAVLALWREVAWESGAPRREFQLTAEGILEAERRLAAALTGDRNQDAGV